MESISDTITKGYRDFKRNPSIVSPMLIYLFINFIIGMIYQMISFALTGTISYASYSGTSSSIMGASLIILLVSTLIYTIILLLAGSYFGAGSIGLSKDAVTTGKVNWSDMWGYGKKYYGRVFWATLLTALIYCVCMIFFIPFIYNVIGMGMYSSSMTPATTAIASLGIGLLLSFIYIILVSFVIYFVTYAIVIDNMSVKEGFKKSYRLFREHTSKVISFILVIFGIILLFILVFVILMSILMVLLLISPVLIIIGFLGLMILNLIFIVAAFFLGVLSYVWTTRFYLTLTEQPVFDEETIVSQPEEENGMPDEENGMPDEENGMPDEITETKTESEYENEEKTENVISSAD
ncbi:DUF7544 domain-containing protein [Methanolapillus ohkumae]|uniref:DUF7847 domain-containing protein n=1 Tax=Methanolapillus ohkumae TaxID=3028298 RepID=A0AA96V6B0_9EURY|nr:hypothetical protein MsAm2_06910 [Methanosarcinaceae archaeon Am2]